MEGWHHRYSTPAVNDRAAQKAKYRTLMSSDTQTSKSGNKDEEYEVQNWNAV